MRFARVNRAKTERGLPHNQVERWFAELTPEASLLETSRATSPPAAACASRMSSPRASVSLYVGGSTSSASRSWTERSAPICGARAPRHQSTLALSTASASALASVRERPDTVAALIAWLSLTPAQRRPAFTSTAPISRKAISTDRDPKASSMVSAFTDAAPASSARSTANSGDASPVRFTPSVNPGSGICREELRTFSPRTLCHFSRPSGRRHKYLPPALRPVASAAPCRRIHRKTPDVSHGIGQFSEFYVSGPARPLRCRPRRRQLRRLRLHMHPLTGVGAWGRTGGSVKTCPWNGGSLSA